MPRTRVHTQGTALSSSTPYRAWMGIDLLLINAVGIIAVRMWMGGTEPSWYPPVMLLWALLTFAMALRSVGLWAGAMVWRRRLAFLAILGVVWRGCPIGTIPVQVGVILWGAVVWIVLLLEGRRVALAVSEATGEEVLEVDPEAPAR